MHSYHIPPNIDQSGFFLYGMVRTRNGIEAAAAGFLMYQLASHIFAFLPYTFMLTISIMLTGATAIFFAFGMDDKSVLTAIIDRYKFSKRKSKVTLGVPLPQATEEKKVFLRKSKKGEKHDLSI